jgi:ATP-dependent DNA ligase
MYRPGKRSDDWVKVRFGNRQEFVVGGYRPSGDSFDALIVRWRRDRCPFADLPVTKHGRWGEGITAEDMAEMQWVGELTISSAHAPQFDFAVRVEA